jgi:hypothetical protein
LANSVNIQFLLQEDIPEWLEKQFYISNEYTQKTIKVCKQRVVIFSILLQILTDTKSRDFSQSSSALLWEWGLRNEQTAASSPTIHFHYS